MKIIKTQKELIPLMQNCYKAKNNIWHKSSCFKGLYYWSVDGLEFGMFPTIYAILKLLKSVSLKLFGIEGNLQSK